MISIHGFHIFGCPPYPLRPKDLKCPLFISTGAGEQPESPDDMFLKDSEIPGFGRHGAYPPKPEGGSIDFAPTVETAATGIWDEPDCVPLAETF